MRNTHMTELEIYELLHDLLLLSDGMGGAMAARYRQGEMVAGEDIGEFKEQLDEIIGRKEDES